MTAVRLGDVFRPVPLRAVVAVLVNNAGFESNPRGVETFQNEVRKPRHRTAAVGAHI